MSRGSGKGDVATEAVPDEYRSTPGEEFEEVSDLRGHVERPQTVPANRSAVAAAVVAQHTEPLIEPATQAEHARRTIHGAVDQSDERSIDVALLI